MFGFKHNGMTKDYSQMLNRLSRYFFLASLLGIELLLMNARFEELIRDLVQSVPVYAMIIETAKVYFNVPENNVHYDYIVTAIILALVFAAIGRVIHLHERISRMLGIRKSFDIQHILEPLAKSSGARLGPERLKAFGLHRETLMRKVFYKHASSTRDNLVVDAHDIQKALDNWTYCWAAVEGIFLCLIFLFVSVLVKDDCLISIFATVFIAYVFAYAVFRNRAEKLIIPQIQTILSNGPIKQEIRTILDAI